jgi:bis(5'-nucleosidyl)-tetraphosphatase
MASGTSMRLSAGAVVVRHDGGETRFLLLRAFNHWDFPKGMVEDGETPFAAALREIHEETTLDGLDFRWGREYVETGPYSRGKVARYYLAATGRADVELPVNPELGRPEHSEYRWVDYSQALALASPRLRPVVHWAARMIGIVHVAAPPSAPAD